MRLLFRAGALLAFVGSLAASGYSEEPVSGLGLGVDFHSTGANPLPSAGVLWARFGYLSYQARGTFSYRPSDGAAFVRGGVGAGFILVLLNFDLTYQTGDQRSAGMYVGLSSFLSGARLTPELFAGYQMNFSGSAENFFIAGLKCYYNFAAR